MIKTIDSSISVFEITGTDTTAFLNNQVVTELKPVSHGPKFTAICNPKGRIIFTMIVTSQAESTFVAVDSSLCDNFYQYVNMRRFRMDVKINKSTHSLAFNITADQPTLANDVVLKTEPTSSTACEDEFWLFMFKAGLPWITNQSSEQHIPQHLNLDQLQVIDFDKGCYPGQEIVARLHFLGKVKKRMQYIKYQSEQAHEINSKPKLTTFDTPVEICAPSIKRDGCWHSQAIIASQ